MSHAAILRPKSVRVPLATAAVLGGVLAASSCGDSAPTEPPASVATTVTVTPGTATLEAIEATVQLAATVRDQFGWEMQGSPIAWSTSDPPVATVDAAGLVAAVANGTVTVTATSGPASGTAAVTIDQVAARVELYPQQTIFPTVDPNLASPILIDVWDANGNPLALDQYPPLAWRSSDEGVAAVSVDADGPNATVVGQGSGATTITATVDGVVANTEVLVEPLLFRVDFAQNAPAGAPVIINRPGILRLFWIAYDFAELKRGPTVEVMVASGGNEGRSIGVAELDRQVPKLYYPYSLDGSINYRIPARDIKAKLRFDVYLVPTIGSDRLPLDGDLRDLETHYVVPDRRRLWTERVRTYPEAEPIKIVVRPIVQLGNINRATIAQADSLSSGPYLHEKWNPFLLATPLSELILGKMTKGNTLYVSHDPDSPSNMTRTVEALYDAWYSDECRWFFGRKCSDWYYLGITGLSKWWGDSRIVKIGNGPFRGAAAISGWHGWTIAHEVAHLIQLGHAPCGTPDPDKGYRPSDGSLGVTPGYVLTFRVPTIVSSHIRDYMTYCRDHENDPPVWVSRYHFTKAHNNLTALAQQQPAHRDGPRVASQIDRVLVIGGGRYDGTLELDPAFVVPGQPLLPSVPGPYELVGVDASGDVIFLHRFDMDWYRDSPTGDGSFRIAIPAFPAWGQSLEGIVLSGPEGLSEMGRDTEEPKTWVVDTNTGSLRAVLRGADALTGLKEELKSAFDGESFVVITSRGIPDGTQWTRGWRIGGPTMSTDARRVPVLVRKRP